MKGGIYSIDGSEVCEHSMDITFKDEDDEPPAKKVRLDSYLRLLHIDFSFYYFFCV